MCNVHAQTYRLEKVSACSPPEVNNAVRGDGQRKLYYLSINESLSCCLYFSIQFSSRVDRFWFTVRTCSPIMIGVTALATLHTCLRVIFLIQSLTSPI